MKIAHNIFIAWNLSTAKLRVEKTLEIESLSNPRKGIFFCALKILNELHTGNR